MNFGIWKPVRLYRLILFVVFALALSACGGDDGGEEVSGGNSGSGEIPEACSLLTVEEVTAVLGQNVNPVGDTAPEGLFSNCSWIGTETSEILALNIWGSSNPDDDWAETFIDAQVGLDNSEEVSTPDGALLVTRDAYWGLYWAANENMVVVLTASGTDASRDDFIRLGEKIDGGL